MFAYVFIARVLNDQTMFFFWFVCLCVTTNKKCTVYDFGIQADVCVSPGTYLETMHFPEICQRYDDDTKKAPRYLFKTKCHGTIHEMREINELNDRFYGHVIIRSANIIYHRCCNFTIKQCSVLQDPKKINDKKF